MNENSTIPSAARHKIYIALAIALLAIPAAFLILNKRSEKLDTPALPPLVRVYMLDSNSGQHFQLTGTVEARVESHLGFRVPGKIVKRLVDQGQDVVTGQSLMELDAIDLELAQKAAKAAVVAAKAENLRALQDEERQKALVREHAVSQKEYDLAKALADSTTANLHAAEATARQIDNQVQYAILRADSSGVVTDVSADVGQVVATGQNVVSIAQDGMREAVVHLPETMISYAKDAKNAFLYSAPSKRINVTLRELSAIADQATRTYQARYTLEGDGQSAPLGSTITVSFTKADRGDTPTFRVPIGALYDKGSGSSVWFIQPSTSTVQARAVTVTDLGEEYAQVTGNLSAGDHIVALGVHLLKENIKVRPLDVNTAGEK